MKKFFIAIAALALVASAACTKVKPEEKKAEKISFQVANYVPQTKADPTYSGSSLESEGYETFNCYAWYFGAPMQYMNNVAVNKGASAWAPAEDYYWPKTGYINFYSYAGTKAPSVTPTNGMKTVTVTYSGEIAADDNFLLADPALHFGLGQANYDDVKIVDEQGDFSYSTGNYAYSTYSTPQYQGVPTLFHHMLAKVAFVVKLATAESNKSENTTWEVVILNTTANPSNIAPYNTGSLTLTNTDDVDEPTVGAWTTEGWAGTATKTLSFASKTLTIQPNAIESTETDNILLPLQTVMPQATSGIDFNFAYQINAKHGKGTDAAPYTTFMSETITIPTKKLSEVASTVTSWDMNEIILYTITIDPVGKKVTFDPAVVEWTSEAGAINLPL